MLTGKISLLEFLSAPAFGADVNQASSEGFTPLMYAVIFNGDVSLVRALLEKGADADAETSQGMTALMWSLLSETRDPEGYGAAVFESEENRRAVAMELVQRGADVNRTCWLPRWQGWTPLLFAALDPNSNASVIEALIAAGADVHARTQEGLTALIHAAAFGRSSAAVHSLIQAGAVVDAAGKQEGREGWTPLLYALASPLKSLPIVRELVLHGADVNITVRGGSTPLLFAVGMRDEPAAFVRLLLDAGADAGVADDAGNNALDCARANNYKETERLLLRAKKMGRGPIPRIRALGPYESH